MQRLRLAQVNVARLRAPLGSAAVAEFTAALASINRLADSMPGFVWRLPNDEGHVTEAFDNLVFVNLSVWESYQALHDFVYRSAHAGFVKRRTRWFEPMAGPTTALWWVQPGHVPSVAEATARLRHLQTYGPTPGAFSLRVQFAPDGRRVASARGGPAPDKTARAR